MSDFPLATREAAGRGGPEYRRSIERPVVMRAQRVLPKRGEEKRANHAEDNVIHIDRTERTFLNAAPQDGRDQVDAAVGDGVEIEASQLREVPGLGDHELRDHAHGRGDHRLPGRQQSLEQNRGRDGLGQERLDAREMLCHLAPDDRLEEVFLAGVVKVNRPLGHARPRRHVLKASRRKPTLAKAFQRRGHDLGRPGLLASPPASRRLGRHCA